MKKTEEFRRRIDEESRAGIRGLALCSRYAGLVDDYLRSLTSSWPAGISLVALGGYGRGELAPYSDIDIMILSRSRPDAAVQEGMMPLIYRLWDEGFEVGYSIRSFKDCVDLAMEDVHTRTALLEHRLIAGDAATYQAYQSDVYPALMKTRPKAFIQKKLREQEDRRQKFGGTAFLLEPHLKEGEGGLRDVHTALWLVRIAYGTEGLDGLQGVLDRRQLLKLYAAYEFVHRVRVRLHLNARRKTDTLEREFQAQVAADLGYGPLHGLTAEERMLRRYYLHAREISEISSELTELCVLRVFGRIGGPSWFRKEQLNDHFRIISGYLVLMTPGVFDAEPHLMMEAFHWRMRTGAPMSRSLKREVRLHLKAASGRLRRDVRAARLFMEILSGRDGYRVLREMNDIGFLGRYLPEFGRLKALPIRDPYHVYTVDEHTLMALRALSRLDAQLEPAPENLRSLYRSCRRRGILHLAMLVHDTGKMGPSDYGHSHVDLWGVMDRLGLSPEDRALVDFLVRHHLLMADMAQHRDTDDPAVIAEFAATVADEEKLNNLYLMTYADVSAVHPGYWSPWKAYLLGNLYQKTLSALRGEVSGERLKALIGSLPRGKGLTEENVRHHLQVFPARYLRSSLDEDVLADIASIDEARRSGFAMRLQARADHGGMELTLCCQDRPGLLAGAVSVLAANSLNVHRAQVFTATDGMVLDRFIVSNWEDVCWPGLEEKLSGEMKPVSSGGTKPMPLPPPRKGRIKSHPHLTLDAESEGRSVCLDVLCPDRPGLLASIVDAVHRAGLNIESALIETDGTIARDTFHLSVPAPAAALWDALGLIWDGIA